MKQTIIILSLCTAALFAGCKAKQVVTEEVAQGEVVRFSAKAETVTKVSDKDTNPALSAPQFDQGDKISVFAPLEGQTISGNYGQNTAKGEAKDCRYVADNNNNFSAETIQDRIRFGSTSTLLDFYAVWPAVGPEPEEAEVNQNDYTIDLKDIGDQSTVGNVLPYMYSNNAKRKGMQSGNGGSVVNLTFRYVLSKVKVEVEYDPSMMGGELTGVEFYADGGLYRECVIDLKQEAYDKVASHGGRTSAVADDTNPYQFWVLQQVAGTNGLVATSTWGYVVPNAGAGKVVNPVIRLTFNGGTNLICPIPKTDKMVTGGLLPGKEYRYIVDIEPETPVTVEGSIEEWEVVGNDFPTFWAQ